MFYQHRRRFAFALAVCLLFGLLPGTSRAEHMQTEPAADTPAAETVETNVPAVEMPTDTYEVIEAEQVSLSENEIRVNKGETKALIPDAALNAGSQTAAGILAAADVVWTSSNPAVATVDSSGNVTGVDLGEATITAARNGEILETYSVASTLANGLYILEPNRASATLAATEISMRDGVALEALPYDHDDLRSIIGDTWYIYYLGSNYYTIHPAFSRGVALSIFGDSVAALFSPGSLSVYSWQWEIQSTSYGYILKNRYYDTKTIVPDSSEEYSAVGVETIDSSDTSQCWHIGSAVHFQGMLLFDLRSGDLVADDFYDNTIEVCTGNVNVYTGKGLAYELEELSFYAQPLDHSSLRPSVSVSFSPGIASYDTTYRTITGNQTGTTTATISRAISGHPYEVTFDLEVCESKQIYIRYDDATMNSTWVGYTTEVVDFLQIPFSETVGLFYYCNNAPQSYTSNLVSTCTYGYSAACTSICGTSCFENHHKSLLRLTNEIRGADTSSTYIYWRNGPSEVFCKSNSTGCIQVSEGVYGVVYDNQNVAFMLQCPETAASKIKAAMCIVAAHEIAHTLGLNEVYSNEYGDNSDHDELEETPFECVMELYQADTAKQFYDKVRLGIAPAFCTYCAGILNNLVNPDSN